MVYNQTYTLYGFTSLNAIDCKLLCYAMESLQYDSCGCNLLTFKTAEKLNNFSLKIACNEYVSGKEDSKQHLLISRL